MRGAILAVVTATVLVGCVSQLDETSPTSTPGSAVSSGIPLAPAETAFPNTQTPVAPTQTGAPSPEGTGSIVYILDSNVWVAAPDGSMARAVTSNGTADDPYHDPSQADDGTIFVLQGETAMHRLDRSGNDLADGVRLPTLENGRASCRERVSLTV